ncbi:RNA 2',3'-cyclic phosphodiesterase [bacterium LRH843]|nr:RNA 2',3'-cyclic phosphodiesterase [bacterium LRH843]
MQPHYFFAITVPDHVKNELDSIRNNKSIEFKRWVHRDDLHLTLVFLGSCTEQQLNQIKDRFGKMIASFLPFQLMLSKAGVFGQKSKPRIFWVGVKEEPTLFAYQKELFKKCETLGFSLDKRPFSPHITLARQWTGDASFTELYLDQLVNNFDWEVNEIILYESQLTGEPKYKAVKRFELGSLK